MHLYTGYIFLFFYIFLIQYRSVYLSVCLSGSLCHSVSVIRQQLQQLVQQISNNYLPQLENKSNFFSHRRVTLSSVGSQATVNGFAGNFCSLTQNNKTRIKYKNNETEQRFECVQKLLTRRDSSVLQSQNSMNSCNKSSKLPQLKVG